MTLPTAVTLAGLFSAVLAAGDGPVAYTINSTEYYTVAPGANARRTYNNEVITKIIRARRSDGSTAGYYVHVPTDSTDIAWDEVTIIDVTARKFVEAALFLNAKSTFVLTERGLQDQLNPGADPAKYCLQVRRDNLLWMACRWPVVTRSWVCQCSYSSPSRPVVSNARGILRAWVAS